MEAKEQGGAARIKRYRKRRTRIDYFPSEIALAVIEKYKAAGLDNCLQGVIDQLVVAGSKVLNPKRP